MTVARLRQKLRRVDSWCSRKLVEQYTPQRLKRTKIEYLFSAKSKYELIDFAPLSHAFRIPSSDVVLEFSGALPTLQGVTFLG